MSDSKIEIQQRKYNKLKISYYTYEIRRFRRLYKIFKFFNFFGT